MARFVFLSDTHIGPTPPGYQQQPGYTERLGEILAALDAWIREAGDIDFVLHGGDMVNVAEPAEIDRARSLFDLSAPVYLCLGNHDMIHPAALELWLDAAPEFFGAGGDGATFSLACGSCIVDVLPTQWCERPWFWAESQQPHFLPAQIEKLDASLAAHPRRPHILVTHSQVLPVPPEQTGFDEPFHGPAESFRRDMTDLLQQRPAIRCVLSGHTHLNMHIRPNGAHIVTAGALGESPFEFKLIQADPDALIMETVALVDRVGFTARYDFDRTFVQGRAIDRRFREPIPPVID